MSNEEHVAAIRCVVETVKKQIPVIAGTGVNDTRHSVYLTQEAEEAGADGVLTVIRVRYKIQTDPYRMSV